MTMPLWEPNDAAAVLATYGGYADTVTNHCIVAFVGVAAIQMIYAALGAHLVGRPIDWTKTLGYPIACIVALLAYKTITADILGIFKVYGDMVSWQGAIEMKRQEAEAMTVWGAIKEGKSMVTAPAQWSFIKALTLLSLFFSTAIFYFLEMFQLAAIGVLYILGPIFVLCLGFAPTSRVTWKWLTCWVEVSSWPLIYRVICMGMAAMSRKVTPVAVDLESTVTAGENFQKVVSIVVGILMTAMVPVIARVLIGGGMGALVGTAGVGAMTKAAQVAGSVTAAAATGGAAMGAAGAIEAGAKALANSMGVRGLSDSPQLAAAKADQQMAHRNPNAAAAQKAAVRRAEKAKSYK